jgi:anti-anti-sigma factor
MDPHALTIEAIRDGSACTLVLSGELDFLAADEFLDQALWAVDDHTGWLVLDLAGVTFIDSAGARALRLVTSFTPAGCPVTIGSISPLARRIIELLGQVPGEPPETEFWAWPRTSKTD